MRNYLLLVCLAVLFGAAGWSMVLAADPVADQTVRTLAIGGVGLFSILAGSVCAQLLKPWLRSRATPDATRLTR
jgi:hypothetical protein